MAWVNSSGVSFDRGLVEHYISRGIRDYYYLAIILDAQGNGASPLLRQALQERLNLFKEVIFLELYTIGT